MKINAARRLPAASSCGGSLIRLGEPPTVLAERPDGDYRAVALTAGENCSSSVEPVRAAVEDMPSVMVCITWSK